jgi:hypothetical protein
MLSAREFCIDDGAVQTAKSEAPMVIYLAGAIEYAPDFGRGWRSKVAPTLEGLGHEVYDPSQDVRKNLNDEEARNFRSWKTTDLDRFRYAVRKIIAYDLDFIERRAGCIVCYWDEHCGRGAGTQAELTLAYRRGVPVYLVLGVPHTEVSGWILACATEIFPDFESLERYLGMHAPIHEHALAEECPFSSR